MDPASAREVSLLANARAVNEAIEKGGSQVQQFYRGATVLVSGGTGFLGKQLLEKLFRACDIKKVFLLTRSKKGLSINRRVDAILEDPVFDAVKKMRPGFQEKICPVQAEFAEKGLGISDLDKQQIIKETEIIIHGAATAKFDEPLKISVNTNVRGTIEMLELAKQCKKLKSFVHISTAYAHATRTRINQEVEEMFYDPPISPKLAIETANTMEESRLNDITPYLIKEWPNTFTYTKAIAEEAVKQAQSDLPISIVRPAMVIASLQEPSPGWLDKSCAFGPTGILLGSSLGILHTVLCDPNNKIDVVPVDLVNNAIIIAGWAAGKLRASASADPIYTVTSMRNYITWGGLLDTCHNETQPKYSTPNMLYYPFLIQTSYKLVYLLLTWLWHFIPAYIIDFVLILVDKKSMAVREYTRADHYSEQYYYFTSNEWLTKDKNLQQTYKSLGDADRQIFNCDVASVKWKDMAVTWSLGVRKYIIKDGLQGSEYAGKKQFWFKILHYTVVAPLYFYILYSVAVFVLNQINYGVTILNKQVL